MANPNRAVAEFNRRHPRARTEAQRAAADARHAASPFAAIMDAVSRFEITPEEGARRMKEVMS